MSWLVHHTRSEGYASQAEELHRQQDLDRAAEFYRLSAEAEVDALNNLDTGKARTIGITAVSATSLYFKAREFSQAKRVAHKWLATELLPPFAVEELEDLLQAIRNEESYIKLGTQPVKGDVLIIVSGGDVAYSAAPLELVLRKVEQISNLLYRTTELMLGLPIRTHGAPNQTVKNECDPWLVQPSSEDYQFVFSVSIRKPQQQLTIPGLSDTKLNTEKIAEKFFEIVRATTQDPEAKLIELIPDMKYREIFMKLVRYIAPPTTGRPFSRMELKLTHDVENNAITLLSDTREAISRAMASLRIRSSIPAESQLRVLQVRGILRGFQPDDDWIDVRVNGEVKRIYNTGEEIDDVMVPMVNRRVVAEVIERSDRVEKKYSLRDLQLEEDVL